MNTRKLGGVSLLEGLITIGVPLLVCFEASNADRELAGRSHGLSEDSEALALLAGLVNQTGPPLHCIHLVQRPL